MVITNAATIGHRLRLSSRQIEENFTRPKEHGIQTRIVSGRGEIEIKISVLGACWQSAFLVRKGPGSNPGVGSTDPPWNSARLAAKRFHCARPIRTSGVTRAYSDE